MEKKYIFALLLTLLIICTSAIGLALTIKFAYLNVLETEHQCNVSACMYSGEGCDSEHNCSVFIKYVLEVESDIYIKEQELLPNQRNLCNENVIKCYYNDRNINETLNLLASLHSDAMAGVIILCSFTITSILCPFMVMDVLY